MGYSPAPTLSPISRRFLSLAIFVFFTLSGCGDALASTPGPSVLPDESADHEKAVLKYLWPVLERAGKVGRVYYRAICQPVQDVPIAFPKMDVEPPPASARSPSAAVRYIFRNEKDVTIAEDSRGVVRANIGKAPSEILNTRISNLHLNPMEQYNYYEAISAIMGSMEARAAMRRLKISNPPVPVIMPEVRPMAGLPHLPESLGEVTIDRALDSVATTFNGIVLYGACAKTRSFDITFEKPEV